MTTRQGPSELGVADDPPRKVDAAGIPPRSDSPELGALAIAACDARLKFCVIVKRKTVAEKAVKDRLASHGARLEAMDAMESVEADLSAAYSVMIAAERAYEDARPSAQEWSR